MTHRTDHGPVVAALADLLVRFGANVQRDQIVSIYSEPGKETLARAVAAAAYRRGAKFVDLSVFDIQLKRARAMHASPDTLEFVPPWYGERERALGEHRAAIVAFTGPVEPGAMDGIDPELLARDMLPMVKEAMEVINQRTTNWTAAPCPTPGWAQLVHPELDPEQALTRLWEEVAHVCRLDTADPVAAWEERFERLTSVAGKLNSLQLDSVRFEGPDTELTVGLFPSSHWHCARLSTVEGIVHFPNIPSEEVFTTPDPERVSGVVASTKPLFVSGALITGLRVRFEDGRAVEIDADSSAETLRGLSRRDLGAARLGEVALVDRESRVGSLGTVFFDTLLDENAASHIALGDGHDFNVESLKDQERINRSALHIDFMIGSEDVLVTGITRDGSEVPLLREGAWQL